MKTAAQLWQLALCQKGKASLHPQNSWPSIAACCALCVFASTHWIQSRLKTVAPSHAVGVWACSARDAGVDALRMEALAPSAKRSRTGEAAGQPAGQAERPTAKYASFKPLILFAICMHMHHTAPVSLCQHHWAGPARGWSGWGYRGQHG